MTANSFLLEVISKPGFPCKRGRQSRMKSKMARKLALEEEAGNVSLREKNTQRET